jgi:ubiquinone/menaquinone biosynthesis C-methylase UbiE
MESSRDFDQAALEWDALASRVKLTTEIGDALLGRIKLAPTMDVLDFGCGTGLLSLRMAPSVRSLTGVDASQGMLDVMAGKAERQHRSNVRTRLIHPDGPASLEGEYDLIVSSMVFHHLETVRPTLERMYRVLRSGGMVCIADLDPDGGLFHGDPSGVFHEGFDRGDFAKELRAAGFSDVEFSPAASISRPGAAGVNQFTIFLAVGRK